MEESRISGSVETIVRQKRYFGILDGVDNKIVRDPRPSWYGGVLSSVF